MHIADPMADHYEFFSAELPFAAQDRPHGTLCVILMMIAMVFVLGISEERNGSKSGVRVERDLEKQNH